MISRLFINAILLICFFCLPFNLLAQSKEIERAIENLTESSELNIDYSSLLDELESLQQHPINLNSDRLVMLYSVFLLNEEQLENLQAYILNNNQLLSIYELLLIDGFSKKDIETLLPFVEVKPFEKTSLPNLKQFSKYGNNDFILRAQRLLQDQKGYRLNAENTDASNYLGSANKYYLKYKYNFARQFQWGFTAEKDAGELFLKSPENPSSSPEIDSLFHKGFDYNSFHLYAQNLGFIKQFVLGDYHLLFGQGLTLWTGLSFGKSADATEIKRFESFIKPNTSSTENGFFRGAAVHFGKKRWSSVLFYSKSNQDATTQTDADGREYVSSFSNTGLHRTLNELQKKDVLSIRVFGGRFKYTFKSLALGITAFQTQLAKDFIPTDSPDNTFDFRGNSLSNYGLDYAFRCRKAQFYGEMALSSNGGKALLSGLSLPFSSRAKITLLYRNYEKDYQNLFASALSENTSANNEKGFYTGTKIVISKKISLQAYADFFSFPWLKTNQDSPSNGVEYRAQFFFEANENVQMHLKYKYKQKQTNTVSETNADVKYLKNQIRSSWQYQINYRINERFELRNRIEIAQFTDVDLSKSFGFMLYQDINYQSINQKFSSHLRLAVFNTDNFATAIYAYENDVLYAFSIPSYYGKGLRFYELLNYDFSRKIQFWLRYSLSYYPNEDHIGSGLDEIEGGLKSELKGQIRIKI